MRKITTYKVTAVQDYALSGHRRFHVEECVEGRPSCTSVFTLEEMRMFFPELNYEDESKLIGQGVRVDRTILRTYLPKVEE